MKKIDIDKWWKDRDNKIQEWQATVKEEINDQVCAHILELAPASSSYWIKFTRCPLWQYDECTFIETYLKSIGLKYSQEWADWTIDPPYRQYDEKRDSVAITLGDSEDFWTKYEQIKYQDKIDDEINKHLTRYESYFEFCIIVNSHEHKDNLKALFQLYIQEKGLEVLSISTKNSHGGGWYYYFEIRVPEPKENNLETTACNKTIKTKHHKIFKRGKE